MSESLNHSASSESSVSQFIKSPGSFHDVAESYRAMLSAWHGVILAAAFYGMVTPFLVFFLAILVGAPVPGGTEAMIILTGFLLGPVLGLVLGTFWTATAIIAITILNLTIGGMIGKRTAILTMGGMAGYLGTGWSVFNPVYNDPSSIILVLPLILFAMACGQFGALKCADLNGVWKTDSNAGSVAATKVQFQLLHLFIATGWFGAIFCVDRMFVRHELIVFVGTYLVLQSIYLGLDWMFVQRRRKKMIMDCIELP
jgi:hypothetical protein